MIESTFQILPAVGAKKEHALWDAGITRWSDFLEEESPVGISPKTKERQDSVLRYAYELLDDGDCAGLAGMLKHGEHWRLYSRFRSGAAYLDIETDGLERDSTVTCLTVHRPDRTVTLVHGRDLTSENLAEALKDTTVLVTFNGSCFDVPVLRNSFPDVDLELPHYDLRFACRKVGYRGGLKSIEKDIGISRGEEISEVDGFEAVRLWKRWENRGDRDALDTLLMYNVADTVNLERLADVVYGRMVTEYAGFTGRQADI